MVPLTYVPTEYITAKELEVDGKQYLAVEARDDSDQLKKVALAAALTGAALTYFKHKQQRYPQPNPYYQTSPYAGGYNPYQTNSFNAYPTFNQRPTYATSPYQTYPSYSTGSYFGPFKREETDETVASFNPYYVYYSPAGHILTSNVPKDENFNPEEGEKESEETQEIDDNERDINDTPVVELVPKEEEDFIQETSDDKQEIEVREGEDQEEGEMRRRRDADEESGKKPSLIASGAAGLVGLAAGSYLTNQILALKYQQQQQQQPYRNPYQQPYQRPYAQPVYVQPSAYNSYNPYQQAATFPAYVSAPGNSVRYPSSSHGIGGSQTFSTSYYPSSGSGGFSSGYGGSGYGYAGSGYGLGYGRIAQDGAPLTYAPTEYITAKELEVDGKQYLAVEARDVSNGRELQTAGIGNRHYQASDGVRLWLVSYNQNQSQGTRKPQSQPNNIFTGLLTNGYVSYFPDGNRNGVRLTKRK